MVSRAAHLNSMAATGVSSPPVLWQAIPPTLLTSGAAVVANAAVLITALSLSRGRGARELHIILRAGCSMMTALVVFVAFVLVATTSRGPEGAWCGAEAALLFFLGTGYLWTLVFQSVHSHVLITHGTHVSTRATIAYHAVAAAVTGACTILVSDAPAQSAATRLPSGTYCFYNMATPAAATTCVLICVSAVAAVVYCHVSMWAHVRAVKATGTTRGSARGGVSVGAAAATDASDVPAGAPGAPKEHRLTGARGAALATRVGCRSLILVAAWALLFAPYAAMLVIEAAGGSLPVAADVVAKQCSDVCLLLTALFQLAWCKAYRREAARQVRAAVRRCCRWCQCDARGGAASAAIAPEPTGASACHDSVGAGISGNGRGSWGSRHSNGSGTCTARMSTGSDFFVAPELVTTTTGGGPGGGALRVAAPRALRSMGLPPLLHRGTISADSQPASGISTR